MFNNKKMIILLLFCIFILSGCLEQKDKVERNWDKIRDSGEKSVVKMAFQSEKAFDIWVEESLAPRLKEKNKVKLICEKAKLNRILPTKIEIEKEIPSKYDLIIIPKSEYEELNKKEILYPDFVNKMPNYNKYMLDGDYTNNYISFNKIDNNAVLLYQKELAFFYNTELMYYAPNSLLELLEYLDENPGTFIYPNPRTSEEGKYFIQSVILSYVSPVEFMEDDLSQNEIRELITPALKYLKELRPYMYGNGRVLPRNIEQVDDLFFEEQVHITFSLDHTHAYKKIYDMEYPDYARPFQPTNANVSSNEYYIVIPKNSNNKSGAMLVLNELLNPRMQASLYTDTDLHGMVVYSSNSVDKAQKKDLDDRSEKKSIAKPSIMLKKKVPEIPEKYWQMILKELDRN